MHTPDSTTITPEGHLRIVRTFNAPRALVWRAWTDPELFARWWGPKAYTAPSIVMDVRPGGRYHWCMRGPDGVEFWSAGVFTEVVPIERLAYTDDFADAEGNVVGPAYYGFTGERTEEGRVIVTLEDLGGRTRVRMQHLGVPRGPQWGELVGRGWQESLDKMEIALEQWVPAP